ncbi:MAG: hypothetical protein AB4426_09645 [Xenococcaceae cyanobacterium]
MKFNSTVVLTFILLVMMSCAGTVSALWGFNLGHQALKSVTQPDVNPAKKLAGNKQASGKQKELTMVQEREILVRVYDRIHGKGGESKAAAEKKEGENKSFIKDSEAQESQKSREPSKFPLKGQDGGVTLEVVNASQEGASLLLDVNLKNDGKKAVRFLYSFLDVRDDQDRVLSAITDGLPGELPANGKNFSGTVRIPTALLDDAQQISLTLTDYPDQKLQLKITEIPVVR